MNCSEISSARWTEICQEAFERAGGEFQGFAAALGSALAQPLAAAKGEGVARAFLEGACELARYVSEDLGDEETAVDAEREAVSVARRIVRPSLEAKLQRRMDQLDDQAKGKPVACGSCGKGTESEGRRARRWKSILGVLSLRRRYSYCDACDSGSAPAQVALKLPAGEFTARLEEVCTLMAATVPHEMATTLVETLCGIEVSVKAVQDMTARRGAAVCAQDAKAAEEHNPVNAKGLPVNPPSRPEDAVAIQQTPEVAYMELDGVLPMTREELTGDELTSDDRTRQQRAREEKARGGKGRRYRLIGREVKNAVLYDGKDCAAESPSRGCLLAKTYVSHLGDWMTFALLLWVTMRRKRFDGAKLLVILSDGAEWIRSLAEWLPVPTFLILDLFHVKHRIIEVSNAVFGDRTPEAKTWATAQCDRIEAGNVAHVLQAVSFLRPTRKSSRKLVSELQSYLKNNRDRMNYPDYRARGLRISSAAVESANYHVTGARLKLQGMRWDAIGAAQMAALRADLFNNNWEERTRRLLAA